MNKKILIAGSGGFSKEVLTLLYDLGKYDDVIGFIEPDKFLIDKSFPKEVLGKPILPYSFVNPEIHLVSIAIGDSNIREKVVKQLPKDLEYISLIHPSVIISKWVEIGAGAIICAGCIITCDIKIGKHAHLNLNTTIGHDCSIGDYFTTAPNVNISGECNIGNHVYFGTSSCCRDTVKIKDNVIVGMGAIVTKNIENSGVYIGCPAKLILK